MILQRNLRLHSIEHFYLNFYLHEENHVRFATLVLQRFILAVCPILPPPVCLIYKPLSFLIFFDSLEHILPRITVDFLFLSIPSPLVHFCGFQTEPSSYGSDTDRIKFCTLLVLLLEDLAMIWFKVIALGLFKLLWAAVHSHGHELTKNLCVLSLLSELLWLHGHFLSYLNTFIFLFIKEVIIRQVIRFLLRQVICWIFGRLKEFRAELGRLNEQVYVFQSHSLRAPRKHFYRGHHGVDATGLVNWHRRHVYWWNRHSQLFGIEVFHKCHYGGYGTRRNRHLNRHMAPEQWGNVSHVGYVIARWSTECRRGRFFCEQMKVVLTDLDWVL